MKSMAGFAARIAAAGGLVLFLSTSVFSAYAQSGEIRVYRPDRISTEGRINVIALEGDRYRLTLDHGSYDYYLPVGTVGSRNLRIGALVRLDGIVNGNLVNVDMVAVPGEPYYTNDPYYVAVPVGTNGWMAGVVQSTNFHLGYFTIREDGNGQFVKIDVRHMGKRRPGGLYDVRPGDRVSVNGEWEDRANTFSAERIEY